MLAWKGHSWGIASFRYLYGDREQVSIFDWRERCGDELGRENAVKGGEKVDECCFEDVDPDVDDVKVEDGQKSNRDQDMDGVK